MGDTVHKYKSYGRYRAQIQLLLEIPCTNTILNGDTVHKYNSYWRYRAQINSYRRYRAQMHFPLNISTIIYT